MIKKKVYLGYDHGGLAIAGKIKAILDKEFIELVDITSDLGGNKPDDDYPDFAQAVSRKVQKDIKNLGILVCTSGQGVCISANRFKGIRAGLVLRYKQMQGLIEHNHANVLCLSSDFTEVDELPNILDDFINKSNLKDIFNLVDRHQRRINKIDIF
jgi:ribose 5-phosphate isomerase B